MFGVIPLTASLLAISSFVAGSPAPRVMSVHERRDAAPSDFVGAGAADPKANLNFRIGLVPKDNAGLEKALYAVSEPGSNKYGQHLSFEEVKAFSAPTPEAAIAVTAWLSENGITDVKLGGAFDDWLTFTAPVDKANPLLSAQYEKFVHIDTGELVIRTLAASIPSDLTEFIEVVHPTTSFATLTSGPKPVMSIPLTSNITEEANPAPSSCNDMVTPACLQALYGIPATRATQSSNRIAVPGFLNQFAQTADLQTFLGALRPDMSSTTTFTTQTLDGGQNPQGWNEAGIEANLDIQYTVGIATGVPTVFVSVGDATTVGFLDLINALNAEASPPQVLTTSYGFDETGFSSSLATRMCNAYMSLSARGVSILFSSGDGGVAGSQPGKTCTSFIPTFPAGCPFITSVGATQGVSETAAGLSSGGFSNLFARPSYQASDVSNYLTALGNTNAGRFNTAGRGFPDVAAQGSDVLIVAGGQGYLVDGTSCSSPIFASVISLINDRLIAAGKPVLGFLNPFLYANLKAFFEITSGSNPGCGTSGFPARAGWNPVTGLGTPNFAALLKAAGL
ncbi:family S53 protease-like protein [Armillaria luteobubalina]|uniref:Family S53 protease-like protein n=1 Tax=Armillaria luteobubalina TaxID=153913 RepID=A0AA39QFM1_9AGAR|nr:family S53 protease-like protein [Armillaria luteobubalina]